MLTLLGRWASGRLSFLTLRHMHKQISVASQLRLNRFSSTISIANLIVREGQPRGGRRSPIDKSSRDIARGVVGRALGLRFSLERRAQKGNQGFPRDAKSDSSFWLIKEARLYGEALFVETFGSVSRRWWRAGRRVEERPAI